VSAVALPATGGRPLVAVVAAVPIVGEALVEALEAIAEVRSFPSGRRTSGLLRFVLPDAVVVDSDAEAREVEPLARELDFSVVHVGLRERYVRVFRDGSWHQYSVEDGFTAESVRDIVAAGLRWRPSA
jgi:hypothetical protein